MVFLIRAHTVYSYITVKETLRRSNREQYRYMHDKRGGLDG